MDSQFNVKKQQQKKQETAEEAEAEVEETMQEHTIHLPHFPTAIYNLVILLPEVEAKCHKASALSRPQILLFFQSFSVLTFPLPPTNAFGHQKPKALPCWATGKALSGKE